MAVLAASATAAQAADVYGQVRVSVDMINSDTANADRTQVSSQTSRIGVKGSEDLGGGLSAIYGLEWGVTFANNGTGADAGNTGSAAGVAGAELSEVSNTALSARNQFVGLKGAFGTVLAGTHDTPYKLAGTADVFADTAADAATSTTTGIIGRGGFDLRAANAIAYISPDFNGFHAAVAAVAGENATTAADMDNLAAATSIALVYANGPLSVKYGYEDHDKIANESAQKLTVSYKMGDIGLAATMEEQDLNGADDRSAYLVSATYGMGPITLAAQHGKSELDNAATHELKRTTVGIVYALSKKTSAALAYNMDDAAGVDTKTTTVQLNHAF